MTVIIITRKQIVIRDYGIHIISIIIIQQIEGEKLIWVYHHFFLFCDEPLTIVTGGGEEGKWEILHLE